MLLIKDFYTSWMFRFFYILYFISYTVENQSANLILVNFLLVILLCGFLLDFFDLNPITVTEDDWIIEQSNILGKIDFEKQEESHEKYDSMTDQMAFLFWDLFFNFLLCLRFFVIISNYVGDAYNTYKENRFLKELEKEIYLTGLKRRVEYVIKTGEVHPEYYPPDSRIHIDDSNPWYLGVFKE